MRLTDLPTSTKVVHLPTAMKCVSTAESRGVKTAEVISIFSAEDRRNAQLVDQPKPMTAFGMTWDFTDHDPDPKGAA